MQYTIHAPANEAPTKEQPEIESGTQQENESNDNRTKLYPSHEEITGEISDDDIDWYTIPVKEGEEVSILFTKEKGAPDLFVQAYYPDVHDTWEGDIIDEKIREGDTRGQMVIPSEHNNSVDIKLKENSAD